MGEGLIVKGRMRERKKNFQTKRSKSHNTNKNNNKCHNCQRDWHWKRSFLELKKDKASTLEFGGVVMALEELDGANVLFFSTNVNDDD